MTLVFRLLTLLTIAAAGFAMPLSCAQSGSAFAAVPVTIQIPAAQQLDAPPVDSAQLTDTRRAAHALSERTIASLPADCGKTASQVADHPATFDTQPFVPGYLATILLLEEDRSASFVLPPALIPIESRAGPPDAPPPRSLD